MDRPELQLPMRGGLARLDADSRKKAGTLLLEVSDEDQKEGFDELVRQPTAPQSRGPSKGSTTALAVSSSTMVSRFNIHRY